MLNINNYTDDIDIYSSLKSIGDTLKSTNSFRGEKQSKFTTDIIAIIDNLVGGSQKDQNDHTKVKQSIDLSLLHLDKEKTSVISEIKAK